MILNGQMEAFHWMEFLMCFQRWERKPLNEEMQQQLLQLMLCRRHKIGDPNTQLAAVHSKFSELSSASKTSNPLPTVGIFLAVYEDTLKWKKIGESISTNRTETASWENSVTHWVEAALATDLEVLKLMNKRLFSILVQGLMISSWTKYFSPCLFGCRD